MPGAGGGQLSLVMQPCGQVTGGGCVGIGDGGGGGLVDGSVAGGAGGGGLEDAPGPDAGAGGNGGQSAAAAGSAICSGTVFQLDARQSSVHSAPADASSTPAHTAGKLVW